MVYHCLDGSRQRPVLSWLSEAAPGPIREKIVISSKLAIRFTAASLLAALILFVLFRNIDLRLLGETIKRSSPWGLALAAIVNLLQ